jgi:hypothetical protein
MTHSFAKGFLGCLQIIHCSHLRLFTSTSKNSVNIITVRVIPHSSSEICQPFYENAGTRPVRTQHKDNSFHGKRDIAKFTRSTIWGVQLKLGDN